MSASFESGTSVSYTFKEQYELIRNSSTLSSSIYSDTTLRGEDVSLSFRTNQSPALLLYVSSYYREYLALLINKHGEGTQGFYFETVFFKFTFYQLHLFCVSLLYLIFLKLFNTFTFFIYRLCSSHSSILHLQYSFPHILFLILVSYSFLLFSNFRDFESLQEFPLSILLIPCSAALSFLCLCSPCQPFVLFDLSSLVISVVFVFF